ncbi:glycosyltransferase family 39 protein [Rugamonas sp.]|uniref:ArnT family glycosyltransferase n=1 Tax=Rugamonas sp. TaxID=1926287 RepID=UPI0025F0697F|nr:glycosyltransferase family 39 protein [Rugamonas sp.]
MARSALAGYAIAVLAGVLALCLFQAYRAGFSGADEPAHFLNGYFVSNYLRHHLGSNPMAFATEYYLHYPKISIGHWPPAYYGILGVLFLGLPATPEMAFAINLLVAALPAAAVGLTLAYLAGVRAAVAGCLIYAFTPLALEGQLFFMLDQALSACIVAAAMVWVAYAQRPSWPRAFGFAALSALAVLIKGNGWLIVFVPPLHMLLTRDWRPLASPRLYVAAAAAGAVIVPWYWLTSKIAADGFNYTAGWHYATLALGANLHTLVRNLGYASLPLALLAVALEYRARAATPLRWSVASACLGLIVATLALQSLVPVDIDDRYLAPALPALAVLAVAGARRVYEWLGAGARPALALPAAVLLAAAMLAPGMAHLAGRGAKVDMRMAAIPYSARGAQGAAPQVWIIDGSSGAEGAFIAQMAVRDPALSDYAVRASKLLAASNFMGTQYTLKFPDPRGVLAEVERVGAQYVVLVRLNNEAPYPHSGQLQAAMALPDSPFRRVATLAHGNRAGVTEVYEFHGAARANVDAVRQLGLPAKTAPLLNLQPK